MDIQNIQDNTNSNSPLGARGHQNSKTAFKQACEVIPGGVNSPVRAFKSVGGQPVLIKKASGSRITDIDDNEYIDFIGSWGPMILGHAYPPIVEAIQQAAVLGTSYGAPTLLETEMAELIVSMMPSVEMVRMVNSGTEATMSAIRLARGVTGRSKILKFAGCYHGHGDSFLIKAGSGALTLGLPDSPGVTESTARDTLTANYNDLESVEKLFAQYANEIAAVIVEPVAANMGVVLPKNGFLEGLRKLTEDNGALLIFDEVITGFRLAPGGAQEYFGVMPDITTMGKIIGGGLPVGAYGGKKEIMLQLAPAGPIYQAGTLSGNPLAMAAGIVMLKTLKENSDIYSKLARHAEMLENGLKEGLDKAGIKGVVNRVGSLLTLFFTENDSVESFEDVMTSDKDRYAKFFRLSLEAGIYMAPSQFEAVFISNAHTDEDILATIAAAQEAMKQL
ncbi:glutamate-1-semialdehyde 2,1-aminomutase [Paludibacter propionicigenes WB4]|uniref:Glutamate-1-semialdehyde 2,1-aminomutase n=1 Tax=Paludibacter propionicigenes (strain DSM 17365 / JCM 13257 / WB4) TaxID=694427 RepID=E4T7L9_PALPW|nr:glutamate-1-semialdehyde 2,1-aminomutase [Paludibacter propionicigenes]ADQ80713.1 glutamate-1-semialdehyde 2,1-aminomutase [Paludibacter propionicigenes WB4]